jgi:tRNA dimethylallyltransferase
MTWPGFRRPPVLALTGPTACGKSGAALALARQLGGVVINADSMQVYRELRILTARPSPDEEAAVPHRLYGVLSAAEPCTAERWRALARAEVDAAHAAGRLPILVGGTGLYLRAFLRGLAPVPDIPEEIRAGVRTLQGEGGAPALHRALAAEDPVMAARLSADDPQRQARALEVIRATGRSLDAWQREAVPASRDYEVLTLAALPPRRDLYARIERRLAAMLDAGALAEVQGLIDRDLDPRLPAMKAVGVPELIAHLRGETSRTAALAAAQTATRRYAKRQLTWLRHQTPRDAARACFLYAQFSERLLPLIFNEIRVFGLTAQP